MKLNCVVVDDSSIQRMIIAKLVNNHPNLHLVGDFSNAMEAIKFLNQTNVDLIFLDIHMHDFSGFDFIQTLKNPPKIILVTSDRNFSIEAFEYECVIDYILNYLELIFKSIFDNIDQILIEIPNNYYFV